MSVKRPAAFETLFRMREPRPGGASTRPRLAHAHALVLAYCDQAVSQGIGGPVLDHVATGLAVVDVFHGLNRGSPLRGIATKQPTHLLSSQAAHIRPPFRDSFSSNI